MNIREKLEALGFDSSDHDAAVHAALNALAEYEGVELAPVPLVRDPAARAKEWWEHVKECDACTLPRPAAECVEGHRIYRALRDYRPTRRGSVRVEHRNFILSRGTHSIVTGKVL